MSLNKVKTDFYFTMSESACNEKLKFAYPHILWITVLTTLGIKSQGIAILRVLTHCPPFGHQQFVLFISVLYHFVSDILLSKNRIETLINPKGNLG